MAARISRLLYWSQARWQLAPACKRRSVANEVVLPLQAILNGLIAGCEYGLVAAGLALIYQVRSFFHLAHGAVYLTSAYVANLLIVEQHWSPQIGIAAALLWGTGLGVLMEL